MYILNPLYYIYKPSKRKDLIAISKKIAEREKVAQIVIVLDMIWCSIRYGAMWTEYDDLGFYYRTPENRNTFITTFYNFKLYDKINDKKSRDLFHEKIAFLNIFSDYIKRSWLDISNIPDNEVVDYLREHRNVVVKASFGDSGKEVEVMDVTNKSEKELQEVVKYFREHNFNLIEERILNHSSLNELNATSLNTLRIVTVKTSKKVDVLFAGIRVGSNGAMIDNISQGGRVARVDIETGIINSRFYTKTSSHTSFSFNSEDFNPEGHQIPFWDEVINTVKKAAYVVPQVQIVAWDVAITRDGYVELVEGNESFGSVIMQLYYNHKERGIKPKLLTILEDK